MRVVNFLWEGIREGSLEMFPELNFERSFFTSRQKWVKERGKALQTEGAGCSKAHAGIKLCGVLQQSKPFYIFGVFIGEGR